MMQRLCDYFYWLKPRQWSDFRDYLKYGYPRSTAWKLARDTIYLNQERSI